MRFLAMMVMVLVMFNPVAAQAWWEKDWPYRKQISVDMTTTGVNVAGPVGRTPVLVRLHTGNFSFAEVAENGADLRFIAADDKTPLTYHIESFDALLGVANIWVDVPKLAGGEKQAIWLYYGNKDAPAAVNTAGSFDADYALVFHYDDPVAKPVLDKSNFKNNATNAPAGANEGAIIGRGARFSAGGLTIPTSPSLATAAGGAFTFSTWVKADAQTDNAQLYARGPLVIGLAQGVPYVSTGGTQIKSTQLLTAGQWSHLAVVADGKNIRIYVNGVESIAAPGALPALAAETVIGGSAAAPFAGELDETRISKVARPANMMLADANGQGMDGKLVVPGADEKQGGGENIMGYIFAKTPLLEWIIVGICMAMLLVACLVIWTKNTYLNKSLKGNEAFMERYHAMHTDLTSLKGRSDIGAAEQKVLATSPLARLFESGIVELDDRRKRLGNVPFSSETVAAMRSAIDADQVGENQKLDKWMVLLTIAISGGPFIGLLGTVMGVMKTFAGVAMAGDVNINAIAPGISAALLATVAGLAAAIPALFGYNYLNSKIATLGDDMRVFVDRLITRLAETQFLRSAPPPPPHRMAAE
jgi:biopolymer transport protein ExbB